MTRRFPTFAGALALAAVLPACTSFSPDGGFATVAQLARERTGQTPRWQRTQDESTSAQARVTELLRQPLSADSSVEIALLNNRGLQARFGELGLAEAELVRAGRLADPSFGFSRLSGGGVTEIGRSFLINVMGLLTLPAAQQAERQRFEAAQYQAAFEAVSLAGEARRAFFAAVAAQQLAAYAEQVQEAADASSELARLMVGAGNFSALAQMRQQAFHADAVSQLARSRHQALVDRERLVRLLGLSSPQLSFTLPEHLPELPHAPAAPADAEQTAMDHRLDVLMAKRTTEATAQSLGLAKTTRFVNALELGYANKSLTGQPRENGYEVRLELPLFDFGSVRSTRAETLYLQSVNRTAEVAVNARSEVRVSYSAYRTAYALAKRYRDEIVPLQKRISDENLLRYNGMLLSVFELLADAREQIASVTASVEALRDHWVAETDLQQAIAGRLPPAP